MPNIIEITDLSAPELDAYVRLTESQLRARQEPEKGIFIAEGLTVIGHALDAGCEPLSFLVERRHIEGKARATIERCPDVPVYTAESSVLAQLTGFQLTRGVLCAMRRPALQDIASVTAGAHRIAVLENIVDPTNVGAIFRCAAALGMDAVLFLSMLYTISHRNRFGSMILAMRRKFSGSFSRIQRILGAVKPAKAMLAVRAESLSLPISLFK